MSEILDAFSLPAIYIAVYLVIDFLITGMINRKENKKS